MSQSKLSSFYEALMNTLIGYFVSLAVQLVVYPIYGATFTLVQNIEIGLIFMVVSIIRGYVIRRWFNAKIHKAALILSKENTQNA
jgi:hypothetical protein